MDRNYILEHNIIERYLLNKLTPDERDAFEQFYLGDEYTQDELETAKRLLEGFRNAADSSSD